MVAISEARFEELVGEALDQLPDELEALMDNVVVLIEDRNDDEPELLGLYEGVPLTERESYGGLELPDRISIYRLAICEMVASQERPAGEGPDEVVPVEEEIVEEVLVTVVHEIAHHFGIDDDRLHELGWA